MASQDYWNEAPMNREQMTLFSPTLDAMISPDDPVRLFDEILSQIDWSSWEKEYDGRRGQPPIHPRHVAGAILYGLCRRIRSSRQLEEACNYRMDFIWLLQARRIDHTTFAKFRTRFSEPLKELFKQVGRIAMTLGLIRLGDVAFDGTRVKANNSRYNTRTAASLEEKLKALGESFERMMAEADAADAEAPIQTTFDGQEDGPTRLPESLADLEKRREQLQAALEKVKQQDEARRKQGVNPEKNPAQVPLSDPDSRVMPNKEGGYAPNYTPTATTDSHRGFIVDCEVIAEVNETEQAAASVDRIEEAFGQKPTNFLTDGGNSAGKVMQQMEDRGVNFYAPVSSNEPQEGNPAKRHDPTQPVPLDQQAQLPRNSQGRLDKSCFTYDAEKDQYNCPQGHPLTFEKTKPQERLGEKVTLRVYRCNACGGCPLADQCLSPDSKRGRTITRDPYEDVRERTVARMSSSEARELYNQRPHIAETPFGILKAVMGLRQFLLRGLEKVRTEWRWAATAFNLAKLVREIAALRAQPGFLTSTEGKQ